MQMVIGALSNGPIRINTIMRLRSLHDGPLSSIRTITLRPVRPSLWRKDGRYSGVINRHHGIGWEFVHVCIDDASRVAFVEVMADQRKESAVAFLEAAVAYYARLGIRIER